jgi:hypothetical protein
MCCSKYIALFAFAVGARIGAPKSQPRLIYLYDEAASIRISALVLYHLKTSAQE